MSKNTNIGITAIADIFDDQLKNVDLEDAFERIGDDLFIKGNIDSVNSLLFADDEKAETDIRQIIET